MSEASLPRVAGTPPPVSRNATLGSSLPPPSVGLDGQPSGNRPAPAVLSAATTPADTADRINLSMAAVERLGREMPVVSAVQTFSVIPPLDGGDFLPAAVGAVPDLSTAGRESGGHIEALPLLTSASPDSMRCTGLVAGTLESGTSVILTDQGPLQVDSPLPPGARVEIALSGAGVCILSLVARPPVREAGRRASPAETHTKGAVTGTPNNQHHILRLPLDHRLAPGLIDVVRARLAGSPPIGGVGNGGEPAMLALAGDHGAAPVSCEIVPLKDEGGIAGDSARGTRFRFGLRLLVTGTLQLDGLVRGQQFDLRVRSEHELDAVSQQEITSIFQEALEMGSLAGTIAFCRDPEPWVRTHVLVTPVSA